MIQADLTVAPHSDASEISVLGAMMLDVDAVDQAREILEGGDFHHPANGLIFAAIGDLRDRGHAPDVVSVREELRRRGSLEPAGGSEYLARIVEIVPTAANVNYHASAVRDYAMRRALGSVGGWITEASRNGHETTELFDEAEGRLLAVTQRGHGDDGTPLGQLVEPALRFAASLNERSIKTGLRDLDELAGGLRPGEMTIVGARPSQGKTGLAVQVSYQAAKAGARVGFVSLEMGLNPTTLRFLSAASEVPLVRLFRGAALTTDEREALEAAKSLLAKSKIRVTTHPRNVFEVRSFARRVSREGLDLLVVDYLQLLEAKAETRAAEIGVITRGLKQLALELDIAILAPAQLNRTAEQHGGSAPRLSDLKDSGSQEQDADNCWLLWRPDFGLTRTQARSEGVEGLARVLVAKHRNGPTGSVDLQFNELTATFGLRSKR